MRIFVKMVKGRERTTKWYFQNEREVMESMGLVPTKGSGSNWVEKEDGQNDHVIAQLKSTDKESYKINKLDIEKLEYNAMVAHKIPIFVLQFLKDNSNYVLVALDDIPKVAEYIRTGGIERADDELPVELEEQPKRRKKKPKVKSASSAREDFYKEKEEERERRKWQK